MTQLNLGSGGQNLPGHVNLDLDVAMSPDVCGSGTALPFGDQTLTYIYASHVLEHLHRPDGIAMLRECYRTLRPGCGVLVAVPDTRAIMTGYVAGTNPGPGPPGITNHESIDHTDLDTLCHLYLYSTVQSSHHLWSYDTDTLTRAVGMAGFEWVRPVEARHWWECAVLALRDDGTEQPPPFQRLVRTSCNGGNDRSEATTGRESRRRRRKHRVR